MPEIKVWLRRRAMKKPRKLTREWNRTFWGVKFTSSLDDSPILLGSIWRVEKYSPFPDEPTRPMLFRTRAAARKWCKEQMDKNSKRTDHLADWKFRPVKVREQVYAVKEKS